MEFMAKFNFHKIQSSRHQYNYLILIMNQQIWELLMSTNNNNINWKKYKNNYGKLNVNKTEGC